ncbi:MAG: SDR family NAD(P)-dependent oxidoreductase [Magnetococcales bacterium]|nr:SDR family NAD(P)-dependent oxidoreductase [Magnetococcales bacterium]
MKNRDPINIKSILITGCSSGIGRHCAEVLQQRGWRVFATARKEEDVVTLKREGFDDAMVLDLCQEQTMRTALDVLLSKTEGRLDALFNNGAYGQPGAVEDLTEQTLRGQFDSNVFGTHALTRMVLPVMRCQGYGRIVQNSSVLGFVAMKYRGAYVASKYALRGLTETLRLELRGTGIEVILIEPGPIESRFRDNARAAFMAHIDQDSSPFKIEYKAWAERFASEGGSGTFSQGPDAVAKRLIHALESRKPKVRYSVTFPTYLFWVLQRILPRRWLESLLSRVD